MRIFMEMVRNLVFFLVFSSLVEQLLLDSPYKKYAELFLACLSVLVLLEPVFNYQGDGQLFFRVLENLIV